MTLDEFFAIDPLDDEPDEPEEILICDDCGARVDDDGVSMDARCCFYCQA